MLELSRFYCKQTLVKCVTVFVLTVYIDVVDSLEVSYVCQEDGSLHHCGRENISYYMYRDIWWLSTNVLDKQRFYIDAFYPVYRSVSHYASGVLFISYKFVKGFLAITFLFLVISS